MKRRSTQRNHVPCECRLCGGVKHISQEERRSHIQKERLLFARLSQIQTHPQETPAGTANGDVPVVSTPPSEPNHLPQTPPTVAYELPTTPHRLELSDAVASPAGTPLTPRRAAFLHAQESEPRDNVLASEDIEQSTVDQLMDDDWEDTPDDSLPDAPPNYVSTTSPNLLPNPQFPTPIHPPSTSATGVESLNQEIPPIAHGVPAHKQQENEPDPFNHDKCNAIPSVVSREDVHPQAGVYLLYMLVTWLHLQFHLPFRACSALMGVVILIIKAFGNTIAPGPLTTLPRIMAKLQVELNFDVLPVCTSCFEVYPSSSSTLSICTVCQAFIFKATPLGSSSGKVPLLRYPSQSLESQLSSLLAVPGVEEAMDKWRTAPRTAGRYIDIFDGEIPKNLKAHNGERFFQNGPDDQKNGPDGELRIALTLGVDWFSYLRSQISPSHSSCPISFNVANLPAHLRYRTSNLLLCGIMPGPKEQDPDQCQRYLRIIVNELLRLWKDGTKIVTPSSPEGRLIRIILIAICCDKPAAHKMGGFGSHSHTFFCTKCWIKQADKVSPKAYEKDAFPKRTNEQHRAYGERYANCETNAQREDFVKKNATRWSEFARLPYFNFARMVVIDPMHNLILGLVKTHFYHIWVQGKILRKTKELRAFHKFLLEFNMPAYLGRLPTLMGIPAGGSLTADQWLLMATAVAPIAIPQIWHDYMLDPEAARIQREKANAARISKKQKAANLRKKKAAEKKAANASLAAGGQSMPTPIQPTPVRTTNRQGEKSKRKQKAPLVDVNGGTVDDEDEDDEDDEDTQSCLHPDDPANFFKLCQALRILISREITDDQIDCADRLLREYCTELIELYGPDVLKPNHHYATHTPDFVRDFGPLHGFWTFLFERLNKVLKSYKTNNHSGGELETTFFREFHRTVLTSRLVARSGASDEPSLFQDAVDLMFRASADDRGTVQALARELDAANEDDGVIFALSPRSERRDMNMNLYHAVLAYLSLIFPQMNLRPYIQANPLPSSIPLQPAAVFFDYAVIRQHRFYAANRSSDNRSSLVEVIVSERGDTWAGKLMDLIHINQGGGCAFTLGHFRWFRPLRMDISQTIWNSFLPLGVKLWHENLYLHEGEPGPSSLLPLQYLKNHVARHNVVIGDIPAWATISIAKN